MSFLSVGWSPGEPDLRDPGDPADLLDPGEPGDLLDAGEPDLDPPGEPDPFEWAGEPDLADPAGEPDLKENQRKVMCFMFRIKDVFGQDMHICIVVLLLLGTTKRHLTSKTV